MDLDIRCHGEMPISMQIYAARSLFWLWYDNFRPRFGPYLFQTQPPTVRRACVGSVRGPSTEKNIDPLKIQINTRKKNPPSSQLLKQLSKMMMSLFCGQTFTLHFWTVFFCSLPCGYRRSCRVSHAVAANDGPLQVRPTDLKN